ncbi:MAG: hypothetical protein J2P17_15975 [Mycobacterium sp.]|nr:hypothetical protein [Mycobacterium sp.]
MKLASPVQDLVDSYALAVRSWCQRHVGGAPVLRLVDRPYRHITLSLVNIPAERVSRADVGRLQVALAERLAELEPFPVRCGPALVNTVAVELYVGPSAELTDLQARVANAYRAVFPGHDPAPVGRPWRAHSAIAYATTDLDDTGLASVLLRCPGPVAGYQGPVTTVVDRVVLAPTDAWSTLGMWWDTEVARHIRLGQDAARLAEINTDPQEAAREAKAAYLAAEDRYRKALRSMSNLGDAWIDAGDTLQVDAAERAAAQARQQWWDCAPPIPTSWWPGGWYIKRGNGTPARIFGVWRDRADAQAAAAERGTGVEWTPIHHQAGLDAEFWATHNDTNYNPTD